MTSLFDQLTEKPQREVAGSDSACRFSYQKDWAFCELMDRHKKGETYFAAFEFHDDVLFLSPMATPNTAEFYQVKTTRSAPKKKLSDLMSKSSPVIQKSYENLSGLCKDHNVKLYVVCNRPFDFSPVSLNATELPDSHKPKLLKRMRETQPNFTEADLSCLFFIVTDVGLDQIEEFLKGKAMDLFCHKFGDDHGANIANWVRLVKDEITRRSNVRSDEIQTADELIKRKCVSSAMIDEWLAIARRRSRSTLNTTIAMSLLSGVVEPHRSAGIIKAIPTMNQDLFDPNNADVASLVAWIKSFIEKDVTGLPFSKLAAKIEAEKPNAPDVLSLYMTYNNLMALSLLIYYEHL